MDFNPVGVLRRLKGVNRPTRKGALAATTESDGAPDEPLEQFRNVNGVRSSGPDGAMQAPRRS